MTAPSPAPAPALLCVDDLRVRIGASSIVHGVSFGVPPMGVTVLLGRNGVGKTTTLKAILGLLPAEPGLRSAAPSGWAARVSPASRHIGGSGAGWATCLRTAVCLVDCVLSRPLSEPLFVLGSVFILAVYFFPDGLSGFTGRIGAIGRRLGPRRPSSPTSSAVATVPAKPPHVEAGVGRS